MQRQGVIEKQSNQQIPYGQIGSVSNLTFFAGGFDIITVFFTEKKFHFKYQQNGICSYITIEQESPYLIG